MRKHYLWFVMILVFLTASAAAAGPPPKLIDAIPPNGSDDVPPDIGELVLIFDRPMKMNSWSLVQHPELPTPPIGEFKNPWEDEYTFIVPLGQLEPGKKYGLQLNSKTKTGFMAAEDQTPLPITLITFTAAAEPGSTGAGMQQNAPAMPQQPMPQQSMPQQPMPQQPQQMMTQQPMPQQTMPQPQAAPAPSGPTMGGAAVAYTRVAEPNERAFSILVPKGWQTKGGIFRINAAQAGGPGNATGAKCDFTLMKDQAQTVFLRYLPDVNYAGGRGLNPMFQPGMNYQGMTVKPLPSAIQFLNEVFQFLHPQVSGARVVNQRQLSESIEAYRRALGPVNNTLMQTGLAPINVDAAKLVVEYSEGGRTYREESATAIVDFTGAALMWNNSRTYVFRAPVEEFDRWRRILAISHNSIKIDPRWLAGELKGQDERSRQVVKTMHEIQRIESEITANRRKTNEAIMEENYLMLTGQEDYVNPHTGEVERDTSDYQYRWAAPNGDMVYSNDMNFDPNKLPDVQSNFELSRVRPR